MALIQVDKNVWVAEDELSLGPVIFPVRMTVLRLSGNRLLLNSVININEVLADELKALGTVTWIVAPNTFHHVYIPQALKRYPQAQLYIAKGLHKKRSDLSYQGILDEAQPAPWGEEVGYIKLGGVPSLNEVVLFHRESSTLVVTDLVFNNMNPKGFFTHMMMFFAGCHKRLGQSRLVRMSTKDRKAAGDSCRRILSWPFTRVIMAHGTIIDSEAREKMASTLSWMLNDSAYELPPPQ